MNVLAAYVRPSSLQSQGDPAHHELGRRTRGLSEAPFFCCLDITLMTLGPGEGKALACHRYTARRLEQMGSVRRSDPRHCTAQYSRSSGRSDPRHTQPFIYDDEWGMWKDPTCRHLVVNNVSISHPILPSTIRDSSSLLPSPPPPRRRLHVRRPL